MTRRWFSLLVSFALLALPALAPAQVDFDALRAGVAGCLEIAADPDVASLDAFPWHGGLGSAARRAPSSTSTKRVT